MVRCFGKGDPMRILLLAILVLLGAGAVLALVGAASGRRHARRIGGMIRALDDKYESYVRKNITLNVLEAERAEDLGRFIDDVMVVIKPELDALIRHVNHPASCRGPVDAPSRYFTNVVSALEYHLRCHGDGPPRGDVVSDAAPLTTGQIEDIRRSARDAVRADLEVRELDLKMGTI